MLWKKESQAHDAMYVNFLAPCIDHWKSIVNDQLRRIDQKPHPTKSEEIALQKRNEGNEKYREGKWLDALELYGDSLRFAPPKSEHISLAYANRAACFLSLKMYENCLKDIELATGASYPDHLKPKLDERKKNCLKQMEEDPQTERELRIEPDERFPCLANVTEVRKSENGGFSIVAKTDIDVGQIIGIEDPLYQNKLENSFGSTCITCWKDYGNLVPCTKCARAMFCPNCKEGGDSLHEYECGLNFGENDSDFNRTTMELVHYALQTIKAFPSVDDLMAFVEQCHKNPNQWPEDLMDERSKYQLFFTETNNRRTANDVSVKCATYCAFETLLRISQINQMFQSKKHQRFLMHLIADLFTCGCYVNLFSNRIAVGMEKYFKHSCDPNVNDCIYDGKLVLFSIKPIEQGQELNLCHIPISTTRSCSTTEERQRKLTEYGYEKCACPRCKGRNNSLQQERQMVNDPAYKSISRNYMLLMAKKVNEVNAKVVDDCKFFLRKYRRMDYGPAIGVSTKAFRILYQASLTMGLDHPLSRARLQKSYDK